MVLDRSVERRRSPRVACAEVGPDARVVGEETGGIELGGFVHGRLAERVDRVRVRPSRQENRRDGGTLFIVRACRRVQRSLTTAVAPVGVGANVEEHLQKLGRACGGRAMQREIAVHSLRCVRVRAGLEELEGAGKAGLVDRDDQAPSCRFGCAD